MSNSNEITIHEVVGRDAVLLEKYLEVYCEMFPYYDYYVPYMRYRGGLAADADPRFLEHWWLVEVNGEPAAIREFKYIPARDCGLSMGVAVKPAFRHIAAGGYTRLGEYLLRQSLEQIAADAITYGRSLPIGIVTELQLPETSDDPVVQKGRARLIERYEQYGFARLGVDYYEPPYIRGTEKYLPDDVVNDPIFLKLLLGILPMEARKADLHDPAIIRQLVYAILVDHYGLPEDHHMVKHVIDSMAAHTREK